MDSYRRIEVRMPLPGAGALVYYLDFKFNVVEWRASDNFASLHERLYRRELLDHPLGGAERAELQKVVRFPSAPDGNAPETRRNWKF